MSGPSRTIGIPRTSGAIPDSRIAGRHPDRKRSIAQTHPERSGGRGPEDCREIREKADETLLSFQDIGRSSLTHLRETLGLPSTEGVMPGGTSNAPKR